MDDAQRDIFQAIILDHSKHPHHKGVPSFSTHSAHGTNPRCADEITVYLTLENDIITDLHFDGAGCAISQASASIMTDLIKGKSTQEARALCNSLNSLLFDKDSQDLETSLQTLGDLAALQGVRDYPQRIFCAQLAWNLLHEALA